VARTGYALDDTWSNTGFLVHNGGASSATVEFLGEGGVTAGPSVKMAAVLALSGFSGVEGTTLKYEWYPSGGVFTVPAGATRFVSCGGYFLTRHQVAQQGLRTVGAALSIKVNGNVETHSFSRSVELVSSTSKGALVSGIASTVPTVGTPFAWGVSTTTATHVSWGTFEVGAVVASGTITVTPPPFSGLGGQVVELWSNAGGSWQKIASDDASVNMVAGEPVLTPGGSLVWSTDTPATYVATDYKVYVNGKLFAWSTIVPDEFGNFDLLIDGADWDVEEFILAEDGTKLPVYEPDQLETNIPDPDHERPEVAPIPGVDPAGDTTAADTVQDQYRAMRAAIEDAFASDNSGDQFDVGKWAKTGEEAESADGAALAGTLSGGVSALSDIMGSGSLSLPSSGNGTLSIRGYSTTATLDLPAWVSSVRSLLLTVATIGYFLAVVAIIRSGFSGS